MTRPADTDRTEGSLVASEERLVISTRTDDYGTVRAHTRVDTVQVDEPVRVGAEQAELEREPAREGDSGKVETLEDGSLSIPVFEEELVVTKRMVLRERVILRKTTVWTEQTVSEQLRRERVEVTTEGDVHLEQD